jgi:hypothetical protein
VQVVGALRARGRQKIELDGEANTVEFGKQQELPAHDLIRELLEVVPAQHG